MANPHRGDAELKAGAVTYTLNLDWNAIAKIEAQLDMPIGTICDALQDVDQFRIGYLIACVWAGLEHHHGEFSLKGAGEVCNKAAGILEVKNAVLTAIAAGLGGPADAKKKPDHESG